MTADSAARAAYYGRLRTDVARDRIRWTDAIARERTRDFAGAIRAYNALGARLDALRLRVNPPADDASKAAARGDLLSFIASSNNSPDTREAIDLFDKVFTAVPPSEELIVARAAAKSGLPERAATGYGKALAAGLGDVADNVAYGSVLFRLRRYADAVNQFAKIRAPSVERTASRNANFSKEKSRFVGDSIFTARLAISLNSFFSSSD